MYTPVSYTHLNSEELVTFQAYEMHSSHYGDHHLVSPDDTLPLIYRSSPQELKDDCGCRSVTVAHHIGYTPVSYTHLDVYKRQAFTRPSSIFRVVLFPAPFGPMKP